jgi:hypothetical protein
MARTLLSALALVSAFAFSAIPAEAWTKNQAAAQQRYLACKARLQMQPPCNENWTRQCARRCHARYL